MSVRAFVLSVFAAGTVAAVAFGAPGAQTGPSSSQAPYVLRSQPGVVTKSILTVGDSVNDKPNGDPYRMVGIPDGLGAYDNGDGTFSVLMNHELPGGGVVRAHGATGAFVSKWTIEKDSLRVLNGEDLIKQIATWNTGTSSYNAPATGVALSRLCSADLPATSAFWTGSLGYDGRLFMDGEEVRKRPRVRARARRNELGAPAPREVRVGELRRIARQRRQDGRHRSRRQLASR